MMHKFTASILAASALVAGTMSGVRPLSPVGAVTVPGAVGGEGIVAL